MPEIETRRLLTIPTALYRFHLAVRLFISSSLSVARLEVKCRKIFRRVRRMAKSDSLLRHVLTVRPSIRMEQLGSHWANFYEICYLTIIRRSAESVQVSLKSDKILMKLALINVHGSLHEDLCTFIIVYE